MVYKKNYKEIFTNRHISPHRYTLLQSLMYIGMASFFVFAVSYLLFLDKFTLGIVNLSAFILFAIFFADYKLFHNFMRTATLSTVTLMVFFISVILITENQDDTLLWTIFLPLFALTINGRILGTVYTSVYFLVLYAITFQGISVWHQDHFSELSFIHYAASTFILTFIIYFFERSFEHYIKKIQDVNSQLQDAQHIANIGSWEWDLVQNSARWSDETFYILGLDPKKDVASFETSLKASHPDDRQMIKESIKHAIDNHFNYNIVHRISCENGEEKTVRERGKTYYDQTGTPLRMVGTIQDITKEKRMKRAVKEQKEAFETIFKKAQDGILLIKEGRFTDCNDAAMRMLAADSKEQVLRALPGDISPSMQPNGEKSTKKAQEMLDLALNEGTANFECFHKRFDGTIFIVDVTLTCLEINNEQVIHAAWRDITEKKALEEELKDYHINLEKKVEEKTKELIIQKDRAEAASKAKSEFMANMNHELRTPMNAILGFIHLLSRDEHDAKRKKYFELVEAGSESLLGIINDVLDFSKIESGKFALDFQDVEIALSAKNYLEFLGGAARDKNIIYNVIADDDLPPIHTDPLRLQQIISNLIGNAIKFTPDYGSINIAFHLNKESKHLVFSVEDTGIGISEAQKEKIFEPFSQEDMSTTRIYGGTGLGLTISLYLIKMLGGSLELQSTKGEGSTFTVTLPFLPAKGTVQSSLEATVAIDNADNPLRDKPILVAEDNDINLYLYEELFEQLGITNITFANNGKEAIEAYKSKSYHLVLLDINMPVMDGKEAFSAIRNLEKEENRAASTIIALTANSEEKMKNDLLAMGFDGFLAKPINFNSFQEMLHRYL